MKTINVVAAVIYVNGKFLLSKRLDHLHQGGKWEFPGGKIEQNETAQDALSRELKEELNITPVSSSPYYQLQFDYPEKQVHLSFWLVSQIEGEPTGVEGQPVAWFDKSELANLTFPDANAPLLENILNDTDIN